MTESLSDKRRRAGRRGAAARWHSDDDSKPVLKTTRPVAKLRQGRNDWYEIKNKAASKATVAIYDEIGFFGVTASDFVADLNGITANEIELRLNTPGGDVFDGVTIYNALRDHDATVNVVVDGVAASAGAFIAQAGDRVIMNRASQMMIHDAMGIALDNADGMRETADMLDKQSDIIAGIFSDRTGRPVDDIRALMRNETWFTADEAVEAGLADEVAGRDSASKNSFDLSVFAYAGRDKAPAPPIPDPAPEPPAAPEPEPQVDAAELARLFSTAVKEAV